MAQLKHKWQYCHSCIKESLWKPRVKWKLFNNERSSKKDSTRLAWILRRWSPLLLANSSLWTSLLLISQIDLIWLLCQERACFGLCAISQVLSDCILPPPPCVSSLFIFHKSAITQENIWYIIHFECFLASTWSQNYLKASFKWYKVVKFEYTNYFFALTERRTELSFYCQENYNT